ncbi:leucyl aminopeptidase [Paenibacillus phyllosphaerae]|uniref:Probable cytosol aminopeptidase n=1 Tax=Paenibacillus phyllosphaerae TaxID=274593 RepID=A0A7W5ATU8_9BACL|nr:leucyl aminopeptidase [Paenibacillus phyllosphaerae]MBB3108679.1 leucyl aminopeptidase [Paenibacillus phyllosphaerae]
MSQVQYTYGIGDRNAADYDVIIRFVDRDDLKAEGAEWIHPQLDEAVRQHAARGLFKGEPNETLVLPTLGLVPASHAVYVGVSHKADTVDSLRDASAAAAKAASKLKAVAIQQLLPDAATLGSSTYTPEQAAQAMTEGYALSLYKRNALKKEKAKQTVQAVAFIPGAAASEQAAAGWATGIRRGSVFANAVNYARDLTNQPGNKLYPEQLAMDIEDTFAVYDDIEVEVLDEFTAKEQGMGGLLGVGQGSAHPPRMIVIHYRGNEDEKETWGLIGKGITFDTGGISLKRAPGMEEMISDMGGAAAVIGTMRILAELKPAINVVAVIPSAENMPSDRAFKPGDVLTMMNGTTVEVVNTDAEGRLVLADGLTTAIRRGATKLIDVATLTGAVLVSLGDLATGAIGNDDQLLQKVILASKQAGERVWPLPNYPEFRRQLDSDAADLKNKGANYGAASIAGLFIGAFAEERPWLHLDIAGTAWLERARGWEPKGGTGVMVRTLAELFLREQND